MPLRQEFYSERGKLIRTLEFDEIRGEHRVLILTGGVEPILEVVRVGDLEADASLK